MLLERREKGSEQWHLITGTGLTSFDENSGYPNMGMPPGKVSELEQRVIGGVVYLAALNNAGAAGIGEPALSSTQIITCKY